GRMGDGQQQARLASYLQRRTEGCDELVREGAHETDCVREEREARIGQRQPTYRRIERREQLIGSVGTGTRQPVEQGRLAGVGVADQRDGGNLGALALAARGFALRDDLVETSVERLDATAEQAPVGFQLRFAGTAQTDTAL